MGRGAEHIIILGFLEDARRAAIHQHQHLFKLFRYRRDGEAIAGADIAKHDVDIVALVEVAQLLHLLGGAAVLVDDDGFDLDAAEADLLVRRGGRPLVQLIDDELRAVAGGNAKAIRRRPGEERHDAEFEGFLCRCRGRQRKRRGDGCEYDSAVGPPRTVHDLSSLMSAAVPARLSAPF